MTPPWKIAALGGATGAVGAIAVVFGAAFVGLFPPPSDKQFEHYLMAHPSIVLAMAETAQTEQADTDQRQIQAGVVKVGLKNFFNPKLAFVTGPANAKNTFVEFYDYNCAHCINTFPLVQKFYNAHRNDTRFAFIELPIFGKLSDDAARAALAARNQPDKYVAFHFAMLGERGVSSIDQIIDAAHKAGLDVNRLTADLGNSVINNQMAAAHALAARTGVTGTPFFIINGKAHEGEVDEDLLKKVSKS
jgi:protein-disulfide isomerase